MRLLFNMNGLSDEYIFSFLDNFYPTENFHFMGIYDISSRDNINKIFDESNVSSNRFCILFLQGFLSVGHFVYLLFNDEYILYADPLGFPCLNQAMRKKFSTLKKPVFFNSRQIQDISSKYCGLFVCFFALNFSHNKNIPMLPFQSKNLIQNDTICIENLKKIVDFY